MKGRRLTGYKHGIEPNSSVSVLTQAQPLPAETSRSVTCISELLLEVQHSYCASTYI